MFCTWAVCEASGPNPFVLPGIRGGVNRAGRCLAPSFRGVPSGAKRTPRYFEARRDAGVNPRGIFTNASHREKATCLLERLERKNPLMNKGTGFPPAHMATSL